MIRIALPSLLLLHCLLIALEGNGQNIPEETFPAPRDKPSFIYHPRSKELLMVGGSQLIPDSEQSDVWKWNGKRWLKIEATGPGARAFFPGALNAMTNSIHSFGGIDIGVEGLEMKNAKGDMWVFDGKNWHSFAINNIGIRHHHNMVYADHLQAFVLYGGYGVGPDTVTWLLRGGNFTPLYIPGPGVRYHSGMAYDKARRKVVLYGGGEELDGHWEFDGTKWEKILTNENPGPRRGHSMVYNEALKTVILHGGWASHNAADSRNNETPITWGWNGRVWKKLAEARIFSAALGYDEKRKVLVAYGFTDNTQNANLMLWELKDNQWTGIADYGKWNAIDFLKGQMEKNPEDKTVLALYADRLRTSRQYARSEIEYKKLEAAYPGKVSVLINLAEVMLMQGKTEQAEEFIGKIKNAGLMSRDILIRLGGSFMAAKEFREGAEYYEKALEIESRGGDFYNLACAYALLNENDKSFDNLTRAVEHGYDRRVDYENDGDLSSLKSDKRWMILLEKLK